MIDARGIAGVEKLASAWAEAEEAQAQPRDALDTLFSRYRLVDREAQFSNRPVPEGRWFIDWGLPRRKYGGYEVVRSRQYTHVSRTKFAPALCPECHSPIFTVILPNGNAKHKAQQLCLSCGHWEFMSLPR
ncbi:MAG: hypothetical protein AB1696_12990 [Planctomycetota bacterium]